MGLQKQRIFLEKNVETKARHSEIIGESTAIKNSLTLLDKIAYTSCTVLITGETGTGKELVARAIHNNSPRKNKSMIKVNCATLPANLIESELFGHERGSFTGAYERHIGKFEMANNNTLFLDEIGEMPLELQAKLLSVLQDRVIYRIGSKNTITIDVRIIAATNRNLELEVEEGRFRADLYYRLNIFPIELPSLRERRDDIIPLANHFIEKISERLAKKINMVTHWAFQDLLDYDWPGNIRELEHTVERSILLAEDKTIRRFCIPVKKRKLMAKSGQDRTFIKTIAENERDHITLILEYCRGRISGINGAAHLLGVPSTTLHSKLKRLGIDKFDSGH
ncbi:transcriptional regulator with GAF, ATPase, and Fis domain [Mucilaginibacter sp. SG538B]|uniref:sigma-54 interaction domain-containing protein n=1 Tax=Mucilaginibacter sp. SG538B TaxID=2587021 RepID=UPI00159E4DA0|nr:sigma 54-interacting transcriptional regulator [Mucilaginibacter sp. SG538B]NVM66708.1 transcriptional regulator with GAF, ATPase, and Fis domain [Mucilaginibacter sp. SG538B]